MEPTTGQPGEPELKKPLDGPAPTQIVINSQDGTIMTADEAAETVAPKAVKPEQVVSEQQTPYVEAPENIVPVPPSEESTPALNEAAPVEVDENSAELQSPETTNESIDDNGSNDGVQPEQVAGVSDTAALPDPSAAPAAENPMAIPAQAPKPKKAGGPKVVIAVALIVALLLAGVAVFAFMSSQKNTGSEAPSNQSQQTQETGTEPEPITADEVDAASSEIDAEINKTTGDSDIPTSESVDDQTLGL